MSGVVYLFVLEPDNDSYHMIFICFIDFVVHGTLLIIFMM